MKWNQIKINFPRIDEYDQTLRTWRFSADCQKRQNKLSSVRRKTYRQRQRVHIPVDIPLPVRCRGVCCVQLRVNVTRNVCRWRDASLLLLLLMLYARHSTFDALHDTKRADGPRYPAAIASACHRDRFTCASRSDRTGSKRSKCSEHDRIRAVVAGTRSSREFAIPDDSPRSRIDMKRRFPGRCSARNRLNFNHLRSIRCPSAYPLPTVLDATQSIRIRRWNSRNWM